MISTVLNKENFENAYREVITITQNDGDWNDKLKELFFIVDEISFNELENLFKESQNEEEKEFYLSLMNYQLQKNQRGVLNKRGFIK